MYVTGRRPFQRPLIPAGNKQHILRHRLKKHIGAPGRMMRLEPSPDSVCPLCLFHPTFSPSWEVVVAGLESPPSQTAYFCYGPSSWADPHPHPQVNHHQKHAPSPLPRPANCSQQTLGNLAHPHSVGGGDAYRELRVVGREIVPKIDHVLMFGISQYVILHKNGMLPSHM